VGYRRLRQVLLTTQIALALVLSVGAGLLIRSFQKMVTVDPGFDATQVLTFQVAADWPDYPVDVRAAFYREVVQRVEALPGVASAAAGTAMPLSRGFMATFTIEGQPEPERGTAPLTRYLSVTPEYFATLKIPLLRGRLLAESDRRAGPGALVISRAAAQQFWPNENPIGQRIIPNVDITSSDPVVYEVVGVVGDVKDVSLDSDAGPCMYVSHQQQTWPYMTVALRTVGDPLDLVTLVRREMAEISQEPAISFSLLETNLDGSVVRRRFPMAILTLFAGLALTLAAVGIYGVLSYAVLQRRFEFGVRMVLGAQRRGVLGMVLRQTLVPVSVGAVAGLAVALAASRLLRGRLLEVSPVDPVSLLCVTAVLIGVALLACLGPTRRATSVDPVEALRSE
jgi:predicted permease